MYIQLLSAIRKFFGTSTNYRLSDSYMSAKFLGDQVGFVHTVSKYKKVAGQNIFTILLLSDANMNHVMRTLGNKNGNAVWVSF